MSYSEPLVNQIRVFFLSVGMGVPLSLIYITVQSFFRFFGHKRWTVFTADVVFCSACAFISFFFMVFYNSGRVRLHLIAGEAIGFYVFYRTVGKGLLSMCLKIAEALNKGAMFLFYPFRRVAKAFVNIFIQLGNSLKEKQGKIKDRKSRKTESEISQEKKLLSKGKKFDFIGKIHLKIRNKSV